ncbi:MAG: hypothetical protein KUG56_07715, partial [Kordiimonadaceae bacterium]|nr:hypothetical protein [Kordiimonadaceae bacterium]
FTDCIIGGLAGPRDFSQCSFIYPRYSRRSAITSSVPYVVVSTADKPLYIFKTENGWCIHSAEKRINVPFDQVPQIEEPYCSAIAYAVQASIDHTENFTLKVPEPV